MVGLGFAVGQTKLGPIDLVVVALFLGALFALGFSAKLKQNTVLQYLAAGRSLSLPVFVATLVSTWYGGILGIGESVSYFGLGTWLLLGVPYYLFGILYSLILARRVRNEKPISIPEKFEESFGRETALVASGAILLLAVPAAHVLMLGVLVQVLTGWGIGVSVLVGALAGTAFLYRGGLLADARVSILAFAMMYVGFGVMVGWCVANYPPIETWADIEPSALLTLTGGRGWIAVASFMILGAWTFVDPAFHQRVASAARPEVGRTGGLWSVGFWMVFDILSISTGMYALALSPAIAPDASSLERLAVFPLFGSQILPDGLNALFFCGLAGTIVSAMVGYSLVSGGSLGRDIVCRALRISDEKVVNAWTRVGVAVSTLLAVGVALAVQSIVQLWYTWSGAVVGALLIPVLLSYRTKSPLRKGAVWAVSIAISLGTSLSWMAYGLRTNNPFLEVKVMETAFSLGTLVPGLAVSATVLAIGRAFRRARGNNDG